ncbi:glycosyltransferase [Acidocella sp.]|uniref:glycosyltransferase n=1 Tax=Acidocella sp. TaxID=50710 RepID=UPI002607AC23|nr:glycosyltransferase [Acidocella sp.]MDD2794474.1 glycosyltransferase [Acidocella sp.]
MPPRLIIDMRCLQDRNYSERGIGNHARNLIAHAPEPFIGLYDPALPPLPADMAAQAAALSPHAYLPGLSPGAVLLNPSPMSPDQHFLARLLHAPGITKAVCVHDFIPYDDQENYLTHPLNRLDYFAAMAWLERYDVFFPNSEATAERLRGLYGPVRAQITGVALPPWAEGITPLPPRHILMVGGDDARKNPEVLARAHAASAILRRIPLVISGSCRAETAARLRAITRVELPGRVSEAQMRALYARALCVVTPSRAEGFSLPVIEAAAAGVPSIASDIAAHRALGVAAGERFAPEDAAGLTGILETLAHNAGRRAVIISAQADIWRPFSGKAIAARLWQVLTPQAPAILRRGKPRIAMLTPLPPEKSGIARYAAATARALVPLADVTLVPTTQACAIAHTSPRYDRVLSVLGNAPLHGEIYDLAVKWGSAVLCHDSRLLGLATRNGPKPAAAQASRELGRNVAPREIIAWARDERQREACFLGELARAARPLIFHSPQPVAEVAARFGVAAKHLPFALQREFAPRTAAARAQARAALGIAPGQTLIVSFGFISRNKAIPAALHALALLPGARLVFVGEPTPDTPAFETLAAKLGLRGRVAFGQSFVPERDYRDYLLAADCALQLREGLPGNISGALQDCIAAGLPSVASHDLADNIAAPSYIKTVSDMLDPTEIAAALIERLSAHDDTEAERHAYCAAHAMARYAASLLEILETS